VEGTISHIRITIELSKMQIEADRPKVLEEMLRRIRLQVHLHSLLEYSICKTITLRKYLRIKQLVKALKEHHLMKRL
jgi:hypothetical protein